MISRRQSTCLNLKNKSVTFGQDKGKNIHPSNTDNNRKKAISDGLVLSSTLAGTGVGYALYKKEKFDLKNTLEATKNELIRTKGEINNSNAIDVVNKIKENFIDLLQREKSGKETDIPNCLMITGKDDEVNKKLIEWTGNNSGAHFIKINTKSDLMKELKKCEEHYKNTGERTLISIDGLSKLLKPESKALPELKSIMTRTSEAFHSAIIFSSTDTSKLDQIALQPHRVKEINANINKEELAKFDNAAKRLESLEKKFKDLSKPAISKAKILIGLGAGLTIGALGICLNHLMSRNKKTKTKLELK